MKALNILIGGILLVSLLYTPQQVVACSVVSGTSNNFRIIDMNGNILENKALSLGIDASCRITNRWMKWGDNSLLLDINEDGEIDIVELIPTGKNYEIRGSYDDFPLGKYQDQPVFLSVINSSSDEQQQADHGITIPNFKELYIDSDQYQDDIVAYKLENTTTNVNYLDLKNEKLFAMLDVKNFSSITIDPIINVFVTYNLNTDQIKIQSTNLTRVMHSFVEDKLSPSGKYFVYESYNGTILFNLGSGDFSLLDQVGSGYDLTTDGIWIRDDDELVLFKYEDLENMEKTIYLKSKIGSKFMVLRDYIVTIHLQSDPLRSLNIEFGFIFSVFLIYGMLTRLRIHKRNK